MNDSDFTKALITLSAVTLGFVLSQLADWYRGRRATIVEKQSVRKLVELETNYNTALLEKFWSDVISIEKNWVDANNELNPLKVSFELVRCPFPKLSSKVWESNLGKVSSAFSGGEITQLWDKYKNDEQLSLLHQELRRRDKKSDDNGKLRESMSGIDSGGVLAETISSAHFAVDTLGICERFIELIKVQLGSKFKYPA